MTLNDTQEAKGFYKLSWLQRIGFGSGDLAQNLIFQVICTYLLFFYTDIYGLTPSAVAVMFLVGNVANVIWDPIVGTLIDKSNPRYGKYRSYLLYVGIPLSGFAILCFFTDECLRRCKIINKYQLIVGTDQLPKNLVFIIRIPVHQRHYFCIEHPACNLTWHSLFSVRTPAERILFFFFAGQNSKFPLLRIDQDLHKFRFRKFSKAG